MMFEDGNAGATGMAPEGMQSFGTGTRMPRIVGDIEICAPPEVVFSFCTNPYNMARIFPAEIGVDVVQPPEQPLRAGARISLRFHRAGLSYLWESLVTVCEPCFCFEDIQIRGPMRRWVSQHFFEPTERGTRVLHVIDYQVHFGAIGRLCGLIAVDPYLRRIFKYAHEATKTVCEADWQAAQSGG